MSDRPVATGNQRSVRPADRRNAAARRSPGPVQPTTPTRPLRQRRQSPAFASVLPAQLDLRQVVSTVLVAVVVIATLWGARDAQSPVAGYGVLDERGIATTSTAEGVAPGQVAPAFRLRGTDGTAVELSDLAGKPVVLQFWTSWCLDCVDAIPMFQQVASTHEGNVAVLGIAPKETASRVTGALNRAGATYITLLDETGAVANRYGATPVPLTVVIDPGGTIVAVHEGRVSAAEIEADLAPFLS